MLILKGFDSKHPEAGALFTLPITVIKPHVDSRQGCLIQGQLPGTFRGERTEASGCVANLGTLAFRPGHVERRFLVPPLGATWADVTMTVSKPPGGRGAALGPTLFYAHCIQLHEHRSCGSTRNTLHCRLDGASGGLSSSTQGVAISGGVTMELCFAQYWR